MQAEEVVKYIKTGSDKAVGYLEYEQNDENQQ